MRMDARWGGGMALVAAAALSWLAVVPGRSGAG